MARTNVLHSHASTAWSAKFLLTLSFVVLAACIGQAQTFTLLYNFNFNTGDAPGSVVLDRGGNIYGTTEAGGPGVYGNIYKFSHAGTGWIFGDLYNFTAHDDGAYPLSGGLTFGPDGALYGTASGEGANGYGTVFVVRPSSTVCGTVQCAWNITVLYSFSGGSDGSNPNGKLVFDAAGNIYGTTSYGGDNDKGTVFMLSRSGGTWTHTVLHDFNGSDGATPWGNAALDGAGNVLGTTSSGGAHGWGVIFELVHSGSGWTYQDLYDFTNGSDGRSPYAGLVMDAAGNFFGSAQYNGANRGGTIFELSPSAGGYDFNVIYSLTGAGGPADTLTLDSAGNLYGSTYKDGSFQAGNVFELSRSGSGWTYTDFYDFTGGTDGKWPMGSVAIDSSGNIFGTAWEGGQFQAGVIFEITR